MEERGNILTFAKEYQSYDFVTEPLCEVDSVLLSMISYYDFSTSSFMAEEFTTPLKDFLLVCENPIMEGSFTVEGDEQLIPILKEGGRHGDLKVGFFQSISDEDLIQQFSAVTYQIKEGVYYIAFRGTDNSVVGWKEDFHMSFMEQIPSQKQALSYVNYVMDRVQGLFYIGGHSKGGNLSLYAAIHLPKEKKERLLSVYDHDGPGFLTPMDKNEEYTKVRSLVRKTVPNSAFIGLLMEEDHHYKVVESTQFSLWQHDPYSWVVSGTEFVEADDFDLLSKAGYRAFHKWLEETDLETRKQIVDLLFELIESTEIDIFVELKRNRKEHLQRFFQAANQLSHKERQFIWTWVKRFFIISNREVREVARIESKQLANRLFHKEGES